MICCLFYFFIFGHIVCKIIRHRTISSNLLTLGDAVLFPMFYTFWSYCALGVRSTNPVCLLCGLLRTYSTSCSYKIQIYLLQKWDCIDSLQLHKNGISANFCDLLTTISHIGYVLSRFIQ